MDRWYACTHDKSKTNVMVWQVLWNSVGLKLLARDATTREIRVPAGELIKQCWNIESSYLAGLVLCLYGVSCATSWSDAGCCSLLTVICCAVLCCWNVLWYMHCCVLPWVVIWDAVYWDMLWWIFVWYTELQRVFLRCVVLCCGVCGVIGCAASCVVCHVCACIVTLHRDVVWCVMHATTLQNG